MLLDASCTYDQSSTVRECGRTAPAAHRPQARSRSSRIDGPIRRAGEPRPCGPGERGERCEAPRREGDKRRSVLCIDDDQMVGSLLADGLTELGYAVDTAPDGEVGLAKILADQPDLVLCDLSLPRGLELLQQLSEGGPQFARIPLVLLTAHRDRESELSARRLGADDCLAKPVDFEMLGVLLENRFRRADGRAGPASQSHLTNREKEVLTWVGRGKTSAEIAIIFGVSERTVNFHCEQAMKRLDVVKRTQAVARALLEGLISA
jgi:DNA-binding NarL/FixJ family response regulator